MQTRKAQRRLAIRLTTGQGPPRSPPLSVKQCRWQPPVAKRTVKPELWGTLEAALQLCAGRLGDLRGNSVLEQLQRAPTADPEQPAFAVTAGQAPATNRNGGRLSGCPCAQRAHTSGQETHSIKTVLWEEEGQLNADIAKKELLRKNTRACAAKLTHRGKWRRVRGRPSGLLGKGKQMRLQREDKQLCVEWEPSVAQTWEHDVFANPGYKVANKLELPRHILHRLPTPCEHCCQVILENNQQSGQGEPWQACMRCNRRSHRN